MANATSVQPTIASASSRRRTKLRVSLQRNTVFSPHMSVCIEPVSDHSPSTTPMMMMATPLWCIFVIWCRLSSSRLMTSCGRMSLVLSTIRSWMVPSSANAAKAPTTTRSAEGIARNVL